MRQTLAQTHAQHKCYSLVLQVEFLKVDAGSIFVALHLYSIGFKNLKPTCRPCKAELSIEAALTWSLWRRAHQFQGCLQV